MFLKQIVFKRKIIAHCCTEKTASQWFKALLSDPVIIHRLKANHIDYYNVYQRFIVNDEAPDEFYKFSRKLYCEHDSLGFSFKKGDLGTTFYMAYDTVKKTLPQDADYRIFFVLRDPRDIVISAYYSMKNSHPIINKTAEAERIKLKAMDLQEGVRYITDSVNQKTRLFDAQLNWVRSVNDRRKERIFRYEDLVTNYQLFFDELIDFIGVKLKDAERISLKTKYDFSNFSGGRKKGEEDVNSHYRKAQVSQWKDEMNEESKKYFKKKTGTLIEELGYSW